MMGCLRTVIESYIAKPAKPTPTRKGIAAIGRVAMAPESIPDPMNVPPPQSSITPPMSNPINSILAANTKKELLDNKAPTKSPAVS